MPGTKKKKAEGGKRKPSKAAGRGNGTPRVAAKEPEPVMDAGEQRGCTCYFPWLNRLLGLPDDSPPPAHTTYPEDGILGEEEGFEPGPVSSPRGEDSESPPPEEPDDYKPLSAKLSKRPPTLQTAMMRGQSLTLPEPDSPSSSVAGDNRSPRVHDDFTSTGGFTTASTPTSAPVNYFTTSEGGPIEVLIENFKLAFSEGQKVVIHSKELNPRKGLLFIEGSDICWNFFSAYYALKKGLRRMPLADVLALNPGKTGEAFKRKTAEDVPENRCVTVVSKDKALAVQFANSVVAEAFTMGVQLFLSNKIAKSPTSTAARLTPTAAP